MVCFRLEMILKFVAIFINVYITCINEIFCTYSAVWLDVYVVLSGVLSKSGEKFFNVKRGKKTTLLGLMFAIVNPLKVRACDFIRCGRNFEQKFQI